MIKFERQNVVLTLSLSHCGQSQLLRVLFPIKNNSAEPHPPGTQGANAAAAGRAGLLTYAQVPPETLDRGHCPGHPSSSPGCHPHGLSFTLKLESSGLHFQLNKTGTVILSGMPPWPVSVLFFLSLPAMPSQCPSTSSRPILKPLTRSSTWESVPQKC